MNTTDEINSELRSADKRAATYHQKFKFTLKNKKLQQPGQNRSLKY